MNSKTVSLWVTKASWFLISFAFVLLFVIPTSVNDDSFELWFIFTCGLLVIIIICVIWLMTVFRSVFHSWIGVLGWLVLYVFSDMVVNGLIPIQNPRITFIFTLLSIISAVSVGVAMCIWLCYRDVGLQIVLIMMAAYIWVMLTAWLVHGNLIELMLDKLFVTETSPIWWLNSFFCIFSWSILIGTASFALHALRVLVKELTQG